MLAKRPVSVAKEELKAVAQEETILARRLAARQAQKSLLAYARYTMPDPEAPNDVSRSLYDAQAFHEAVADALERVERGEIQQLIFCMPPRHGKLIADDEPVLTTSGFKRHGDLKAGDYVFAPDGQPVRVQLVNSPTEGVMPVTFSNGAVVRCGPGHLWTVFDRACGRWRTLETREIARRALRSGPVGRGGRYVFGLPDVAAVQYAPADLPLHPYVLGAWLGDGSTGSTRIAHDPRDVEIVAAIEELGHPASNRFVQENTGVAYTTFGGPKPGVGSPMQHALKHLAVLSDKHVPELYLRSSITQRLELLAGLIDTDGHVEARTGRVRFSTCSEALRDGVFDLAAGLGFRPYVVEVPPAVSSSGVIGRKIVYQVGFQPNCAIPTRIPRKRIVKFAMRRRVSITHIGPEEPGSARCIKVAHGDGLYLVGRHLIPTHNTELATKRLAAWLHGRHPAWDIIVATYSDEKAWEFGGDTRAILQSPQHKQVFPDYALRRGSTAKDFMQSVAGGKILFKGRGGALTGSGMHIGLADDLFKDDKEAQSQAIRDQAWNWFVKVFMTRRMGPKLVILTMTRWHSDDIIGRLTDPENPNYSEAVSKRWRIIRFPAIAEDDDVLKRPKGAALWPERYGIDFLEEQRAMDPLGFEALYQQNPSVADGTLFRRENIRYYRTVGEPGGGVVLLPKDLRLYGASDHAVATGQRNDRTCLLKAGVDQYGNIYLLDALWERIKTDAAVEALIDMGRDCVLWWAERGHISKSIGPFLYKRMEERRQFLNVVEVTPAVDKEQRAQPIAGLIARQKVFFPRDAGWTERAVNELMAFPNGTFDDFVDALAYLGLGLRSQVNAAAPPKRDEAPKFGTLAWVKHAEKWQAKRQGGKGF